MKKLSKAVYLLAATFLISGAVWAQQHTMQATTIDPGARGTIDIKADKDSRNSKVNVKVEHLATPALLTPKAETYVVWVQPEGVPPQNEGALQVGKDEKGEMDFTTTSSRFTVMVTAENDAHPQQPSDRVILRSEVQ